MNLTGIDRRLLDEDVARLNDQNPDTVLLVARYLIPAPDAREATIEAVDFAGVVFRYVDASGSASATVDREAATVDELRASLYQLVTEARARAGDAEPLTSVEIEIVEATGLPTRQATVVAAADVTPRMRELTLAVDGFESIGADQFLWVTPMVESAPSAYYTVRRWRDGEIDLWFLRHDHPGTVAEWAMNADIGSQATVWGPRRSFRPPADIDHLLLVADETGIPAVASILEQRPAGRRATVLAEVGSPGDWVDLAAGAGDSVRWIQRGTDALVDAVAAVDLDPVRTYAFGGAESRQITRVRSCLRRERGMERTHVQMTGYWRKPEPAVTHREENS